MRRVKMYASERVSCFCGGVLNTAPLGVSSAARKDHARSAQ